MDILSHPELIANLVLLVGIIYRVAQKEAEIDKKINTAEDRVLEKIQNLRFDLTEKEHNIKKLIFALETKLQLIEKDLKILENTVNRRTARNAKNIDIIHDILTKKEIIKSKPTNKGTETGEQTGFL